MPTLEEGAPVNRVTYRGAAVIPLDGPEVITDGAVVVEGSMIVYVGPEAQIPSHLRTQTSIGGKRTIIMPSFKNGHFHSECWTGQGTSERIFEYTNVLLGVGRGPALERARYLLCLYGLLQCLKGGQTAAIDCFYGDPAGYLNSANVHLQAYADVGMRVSFALSLRDQNLIGHSGDEQLFASLSPEQRRVLAYTDIGYARNLIDITPVFAQLRDRWQGADSRIVISLAPDWTPACSDSLLSAARAFADIEGCGLTTHALETRAELYWNQNVNGKSALRRLSDLGYLHQDVTLGHFVWATDEDIAILAESRAVASYDPGSNLRLSSGIFRATDIAASGARFCIGTDGISAGDREDFFDELRLAGLLQRTPDEFLRHRFDSYTLLRAACVTGAEAARHPEAGALRVGSQADFLLLDGRGIAEPTPKFARRDILDTVIDRARREDISHVVLGGRVVVENGRPVGFDEDAILDELSEFPVDAVYPPLTAQESQVVDVVLQRVSRMYQTWYDTPVTRPASIFNTH